MDGSSAAREMSFDGMAVMYSDVSLPAGVAELEDISMDSASDGWAVSWWGTHLLHWDGATWTKVNTVGRMAAVQMLSATDGWGVGSSIYHYTTFNGIRIHVARADGLPAAGAAIILRSTDGSGLNDRYAWTDL